MSVDYHITDTNQMVKRKTSEREREKGNGRQESEAETKRKHLMLYFGGMCFTGGQCIYMHG